MKVSISKHIWLTICLGMLSGVTHAGLMSPSHIPGANKKVTVLEHLAAEAAQNSDLKKPIVESTEITKKETAHSGLSEGDLMKKHQLIFNNVLYALTQRDPQSALKYAQEYHDKVRSQRTLKFVNELKKLNTSLGYKIEPDKNAESQEHSENKGSKDIHSPLDAGLAKQPALAQPAIHAQ